MIYYDRLQAGLYEAITNALPSVAPVVWSPSEYPRSDASGLFVALRMLSGPDRQFAELDSLGGSSTLPTSITLSFDVSDNARGYIAATGAWWTLDVGVGETNTQYRDRVVTALTSTGHSLEAAITPVDIGSPTIDIVGDDLWSLYGLRTTGVISHVNNTTQTSRVKTSEAILQVEVQCFSQVRYPRGGAMDIATHIATALELTDSYEALDSRGLSITTTSPITDLTALSGAGWESRAAFTASVGMRTFLAEAIDTIDTFNGALTFDDGDSQIIQEL